MTDDVKGLVDRLLGVASHGRDVPDMDPVSSATEDPFAEIAKLDQELADIASRYRDLATRLAHELSKRPTATPSGDSAEPQEMARKIIGDVLGHITGILKKNNIETRLRRRKEPRGGGKTNLAAWSVPLAEDALTIVFVQDGPNVFCTVGTMTSPQFELAPRDLATLTAKDVVKDISDALDKVSVAAQRA